VFAGVPHPFDKMKRQVIPSALRVLRLRPGRKYCRLGDLSEQVGWQHDGLIKRLEAKRKTKAAAWYQTKLQIAGLKAKAVETADKKLGIVKAAKVKVAVPAKVEKKPAAKATDSKDEKKGDKKGADKKGGDKKPAGKPADKKGGDKPAAADKKGADKKGGDKKKA